MGDFVAGDAIVLIADFAVQSHGRNWTLYMCRAWQYRTGTLTRTLRLDLTKNHNLLDHKIIDL